MICTICPKMCRCERNEFSGAGVCKMPELPVVARASLHMWEEPCISGKNGSGTVFFSGCPLGCVYCQNYEISQRGVGKIITAERLSEIFNELIYKGAHNINLVNPTHFSHILKNVLSDPLPVPVVWNSSGYERVETLKKLDGKVQIYLPDLKYIDMAAAKRYSNTPDYFDIASKSIKEMVRQVGNYQLDRNGMMISGVIIRHLVLPGQIENTKRVIDWISDNFTPGTVMLSLMNQYVPCGKASEYSEINRRITYDEFKEIENYLMDSDIEDGFFQEYDSADKDYIPEFDMRGV